MDEIVGNFLGKRSEADRERELSLPLLSLVAREERCSIDPLQKTVKTTPTVRVDVLFNGILTLHFHCPIVPTLPGFVQFKSVQSSS